VQVFKHLRIPAHYANSSESYRRRVLGPGNSWPYMTQPITTLIYLKRRSPVGVAGVFVTASPLVSTHADRKSLLTSGIIYDTSLSMPILLRHWRAKRGYSVRELANRAGVGYVTVVRIENDQTSPTVAMLERLAKALGIEVRDFFAPASRRRQTRGQR